MLVCDRLRGVLPLLLAVSANSPYLDGRDSGLHSARTQSFTRSFPRCGVPDSFGGWAAYREYIELLLRTRSIVEFTQVWWSVRPHFGFGTVEVRICDAQATATESEALAALIVACVAQAARDVDEGVPFTDPPPRVVEENMWRAIRFGLDGRLIDTERVEEYPAREALERLAGWTAPVRGELGIELGLPRAQRRPAPARDDRGGRRPPGGLRGVGGGDETNLCTGGGCMSTQEAPQGGTTDGMEQPSEAELRAAYEAELSRLTSADVVLQATVSLLNIGARRLGLVGGPEGAGAQQPPERDLEQVRDAIDAVRGLLGVIERRAPQEARALREALSQLQMAYAREAQASAPVPPPAGEQAPPEGGPQSAPQSAPAGQPPSQKPGDQSAPGPAESSGRLWVPGR